jgi:hypothetical protein
LIYSENERKKKKEKKNLSLYSSKKEMKKTEKKQEENKSAQEKENVDIYIQGQKYNRTFQVAFFFSFLQVVKYRHNAC